MIPRGFNILPYLHLLRSDGNFCVKFQLSWSEGFGLGDELVCEWINQDFLYIFEINKKIGKAILLFV